MKKFIILCYTILLMIILISVGVTAVIFLRRIADKKDPGIIKDLEEEEEEYIPFQEGGNAAYSENYIKFYGEPPPAEEEEEERSENGEVPWPRSNGQWDSPEIYFHVKEDILIDIAVHIKNGVTKTIPVVEMGSNAEWRDVVVRSDGSIEYRGDVYEMLYYEGRFVHNYGHSNMGWVLEKVEGQMYFEGQPATYTTVLMFLEVKMKESGLKENEIDFLIHRIVDQDMLEFETDHLYIRYISQDSVDKTIGLDAPDHFSIMRRHFLMEASDKILDLDEPEFEYVVGDHIIHETAVNRF